MKSLSQRLALRMGAITVLALFCAGQGATQDPGLKPVYGEVTLKAGFEADPFVKEVEAGGPIETNLGDVKAFVAKAPDFRLNYTAGEFQLTIHVDAKADTTLLINLPDGKWVANDDRAAGNLNPLLQFAKPQSGQYDIWVGTFEKGATPPAKLIITEKKVN